MLFMVAFWVFGFRTSILSVKSKGNWLETKAVVNLATSKTDKSERF